MASVWNVIAWEVTNHLIHHNLVEGKLIWVDPSGDERSTLQGDATFLIGPIWDNTKAAHLEVGYGRRVEWARHLAPWHLLGQVLIDKRCFLSSNGLFFLAGLNGWVGQKPNWTHDKSHLEQIWPVTDWKGAATLQRTAQPAMEWLRRQREWS